MKLGIRSFLQRTLVCGLIAVCMQTPTQAESVTAEEVCEMAGALFHPDKVAVTVLGNLDGLKLSKENLVF